MRKMYPCVCVVLWLLASAPGASGQSFQGGLRGAVKDGDGVIPGAAVTLINEATHLTRETLTNESGEYAFRGGDARNEQGVAHTLR